MTPFVSSALLRTQSDERLLAIAAAGHDRAFEAIVDRYRRPLLRHVRRYVADGRAEDVVQATFVSAWSSLRKGTDVRELRPWLYRIATNGALNALKRSGADDRPLPEADDRPVPQAVDCPRSGDPAFEVERRDAARRTLHGLAGLPERQRDALVATALAGRPHHEVAIELGMTDGALRQLVHRARAQMRTVATALTPSPLLTAFAASHEMTAGRVAEVATGAGGASIAAAGIKLGAVAITTGALVAGAPHVAKLTHEGAARPTTASATHARHRAQSRPVVADGVVVAATRPIAARVVVTAHAPAAAGDDGTRPATARRLRRHELAVPKTAAAPRTHVRGEGSSSHGERGAKRGRPVTSGHAGEGEHRGGTSRRSSGRDDRQGSAPRETSHRGGGGGGGGGGDSGRRKTSDGDHRTPAAHVERHAPKAPEAEHRGKPQRVVSARRGSEGKRRATTAQPAPAPARVAEPDDDTTGRAAAGPPSVAPAAPASESSGHSSGGSDAETSTR